MEREVRRRGFHVIRELGGHGIGHTIHEEPSVPNFPDALNRALLTEGLVLTIEPIIAAGTNHVTLDPDSGPSAPPIIPSPHTTSTPWSSPGEPLSSSPSNFWSATASRRFYDRVQSEVFTGAAITQPSVIAS